MSEQISQRCLRKKRFATEWDAYKAMNVMWDKGADVSRLRVYECPDCGCFHLGNKASDRNLTARQEMLEYLGWQFGR